MNIALISDVHANVVALEAVLEDMGGRGVERILCAGDIVGYYPYPDETVSLLREREVMCIQGNHDRAVLSTGTGGMNPQAGSAAKWTANNIAPFSIAFLRSLPRHLSLELGGVRVAMYHGAPFDDDHYIFEDEAEEVLLRMAGCELLVLGHTHVPYIKRFPGGTIVNPGSVGQPRDGDPDACYAIFDTDRRRAAYLRVPYDIERVAERTVGSGLPRPLADRLWSGR
ncbi:MAG: metallophosphoesterase family protein [Methanomassiliicoccus sp.]|nr:metallophosphoesterase family protein [Methanomassiliicoccus sp.]